MVDSGEWRCKQMLKTKLTKRYNVNDNFGNTEQTLFVFAVQCLEAMICAFYVRVNWVQHALKRTRPRTNSNKLFCITISERKMVRLAGETSKK